jgi:hypothetical protein
MYHDALVIIGVLGVIAIMVIGSALNVHFARNNPFVMTGYGISQLSGVLIGLVAILFVFCLSRFW